MQYSSLAQSSWSSQSPGAATTQMAEQSAHCGQLDVPQTSQICPAGQVSQELPAQASAHWPAPKSQSELGGQSACDEQPVVPLDALIVELLDELLDAAAPPVPPSTTVVPPHATAPNARAARNSL